MPRFARKSLGLGTIVLMACALCGCYKPCLSWQKVHIPRLRNSSFLARNRSLAIPETLPLGSTVRVHYHTMETNGEASDFIFHRNEFVGNTAELTSNGKDHVAEVAARMRSAPFPVLVERSENNSDPELDIHRRNLVAQVLYDFGNSDADQRTIVSPAYGKGLNSREAEIDYYYYLYTRGFNNFNNFSNQNNFNGTGNVGFGP